MRFDHIEASGYVLVGHNPEWIEKNFGHPVNYERLLSLLDFYVFENPCSSLTSRSKTIEAYGWNEPWRKPTYLNRKLKDCSSNKHLYYSSSTLDGMEKPIADAGLFGDIVLDKERVCFYDNMHNQTLSCLYHLRNAFCHGRFALLEDEEDAIWIAIEDVSSKQRKGRTGKKLSARMLLKIETLEAWKSLIITGPSAVEQSASNESSLSS